MATPNDPNPKKPNQPNPTPPKQGAAQPKLSDDERELAQLLGRRLAELAVAGRAVRRG